MRVVVLQLSYILEDSKGQNTQMVELSILQAISLTTALLTVPLDDETKVHDGADNSLPGDRLLHTSPLGQPDHHPGVVHHHRQQKGLQV